METRMFAVKRLVLFALLTALTAPFAARAEDDNRRNILFVQRDRAIESIVDFAAGNPIGGHGIEVGTVSGAIEGTTVVNFQFRGLSLDNRVGMADVDGDRIIFRKTGTGVFLPVLNDPSAGPNFQVFGATGSSIVLTGTYEVVTTTGKYVKRFHLGERFPFRSIATNPSWPPATPPPAGAIVPGTEYVEVYSNRN